MFLSGFPEESLIYCWFGLLLCRGSVSEQCVKTGSLPRSVGEGELGGLQEAWTNTALTPRQFFSPSVPFSRLFDLLYICHFNLRSLVSFLPFLPLFFSPLPPTPVLVCPPFLCLPLFQHNACLWKEVEACFILLPPPPLPSFVSYKGTVDTLVWSLFHAESN